MEDTRYCDYTKDTVYCEGNCSKCGNSTMTLYCYEIENISKGYTIDEVRMTYDTYEECLENAKEDLKCYLHENDLYQATIYEEHHRYGDIIGEPVDIRTISNRNEQETKAIRQAQGYCRADVDEYLQ